MKTLSALVVGLAIVISAEVAGAYVVQVVTTIPVAAVTSAEDTSQLGDLVQSAIRDVLEHVIAFIPAIVRIEDARIIGERLYLVLLIADADGEATIEGLMSDRAPEGKPDAPDAERTNGIIRPGAVPF
jgi:hypothetical protein